MSFKNKKYVIIKKAIPKNLAIFVYNYFLMKRQVAMTLFKNKLIAPFSDEWGIWTDAQVPNTYSHYGDVAMETLLLKVQPVMEKNTKLKLIPTYSYARIYKKGDVLHRHKDRFSCEISSTLNLGGEEWPIYLSSNENVGIPDGNKITLTSNAKGTKIILKPGDMLVYKGMELEHWREPFEGENCAQVFLHYNNFSKESENNIFDGRPHLGLPRWFK
jgi:hypothetical protein